MNQRIIDELDRIGEEFNCELFMPPFNGSNNPFFCIKNLKRDMDTFCGFFIALDKVDVDFIFTEVNGEKDYMEILG